MPTYIKYLAITFVAVFIILPIGCATGSTKVGFLEYIYYLIATPIFVGSGIYIGKLARDFLAPDYISASSTFELFKSKVFWKIGPQFIGLIIGLIPVDTLQKKIFPKENFYRDIAVLEKESPKLASSIKNSVEEMVAEHESNQYQPTVDLPKGLENHAAQIEGVVAADLANRVLQQMESRDTAPRPQVLEHNKTNSESNAFSHSSNISQTENIQSSNQSSLLDHSKLSTLALKERKIELQNKSDFHTVAIIHDPDGYVNIRKTGSSSAIIVGKINDGEIFRVKKNSGNWQEVLTSAGQHGFVHESRIKTITQQNTNYCPVEDHLSSIRQSYLACQESPQSAACTDFSKQITNVLPTYECYRSFDTTPVPAAWLLDDQEWEAYVALVKANQSTWARNLYASPMFKASLDGFLAE